uniref:Uncharacterized protein n=1 Tax=Spongospora subterranea TaxID=70186 RepID=A0A0H5RB30_9EUKA|eukprot:CRZ11400.1 hypothetical protein [Spongospora subterranea]
MGMITSPFPTGNRRSYSELSTKVHARFDTDIGIDGDRLSHRLSHTSDGYLHFWSNLELPGTRTPYIHHNTISVANYSSTARRGLGTAAHRRWVRSASSL